MTWLDLSIIGIIAFSILISAIRGFFKEAFSLAAWIGAAMIAAYFYPYVTVYLTSIKDELLRNAAGMLILFVATLLVASIVTYAVGSLVKMTSLTGTDRVLGIVFGFVRGIFIVTVLLFFFGKFTAMHKDAEWRNSMLIPYFNPLVEWIDNYVKDHTTLFDRTLSSNFLGSSGSEEPLEPNTRSETLSDLDDCLLTEGGCK